MHYVSTQVAGLFSTARRLLILIRENQDTILGQLYILMRENQYTILRAILSLLIVLKYKNAPELIIPTKHSYYNSCTDSLLSALNLGS